MVVSGGAMESEAGIFDPKNANVLIVAGETENIGEMKNLLDEEGYCVTACHNSRRLVDILRRNVPDLILVDRGSLPETEADLMEIVKDSIRPGNLPLLVSAADCKENDGGKTLVEGACDIFTLPIVKEVFIARVRTHIALKKARDELLLVQKKMNETENAARRAAHELEKSFRTDPLTKLPNRSGMFEKLKTEVIRFERSGISFSLVLCDIDDLKLINQAHGHEYGDMALKTVADLIVSNARKQDTVSRWSSEEFLLLLPETDLTGGKRLAEKIRDELNRRTFQLSSETPRIRITLTFGVTVFSESKSIESCLKSADIALLKGKRLGKNSVVVSTVCG